MLLCRERWFVGVEWGVVVVSVGMVCRCRLGWFVVVGMVVVFVLRARIYICIDDASHVVAWLAVCLGLVSFWFFFVEECCAACA